MGLGSADPTRQWQGRQGVNNSSEHSNATLDDGRPEARPRHRGTARLLLRALLRSCMCPWALAALCDCSRSFTLLVTVGSSCSYATLHSEAMASSGMAAPWVACKRSRERCSKRLIGHH